LSRNAFTLGFFQNPQFLFLGFVEGWGI